MKAELIIPSLDGPFVPWTEVRAAQVWRYFSNRTPDPLAAALAREVGDDAVILDYGCGAGRHLRFLTGLGYGVIGIDPGAGQLEIAEQLAPRAQLYLLRFGQPIPVPSESVDGVLSTWAIYHGGRAIVDWSIGEVIRVLKPGGRFSSICSRH